jgi:hypothetical protein
VSVRELDSFILESEQVTGFLQHVQ